MPGARCTRGLVCNEHIEMRTRAYRFSGGSPASPAQWLYGLYRALLGEPGFLATVVSVMRSIIANLAPASGRRDHATSPYAIMPLVFRHSRVHRIPPHVS